MKWLLVVMLANTPVKTDLVYGTLAECLRAEQAMRQQWAEVYNDALKRKADTATLEMVKRQNGHRNVYPGEVKPTQRVHHPHR